MLIIEFSIKYGGFYFIIIAIFYIITITLQSLYIEKSFRLIRYTTYLSGFITLVFFAWSIYFYNFYATEEVQVILRQMIDEYIIFNAVVIAIASISISISIYTFIIRKPMLKHIEKQLKDI